MVEEENAISKKFETAMEIFYDNAKRIENMMQNTCISKLCVSTVNIKLEDILRQCTAIGEIEHREINPPKMKDILLLNPFSTLRPLAQIKVHNAYVSHKPLQPYLLYSLNMYIV